MGDGKLFHLLLIGQALVLGWLLLTWITYPPAARWTRLHAIAVVETVRGEPPLALLDQGPWLWRARLTRLQGGSVLLGVATVIGLAEGCARRQREVFGGFRFSWWVVGTMLLVLMPGLVGGYVLLPVPVPHWTLVSLGLAGMVGLMSYGLARGKPYVP